MNRRSFIKRTALAVGIGAVAGSVVGSELQRETKYSASEVDISLTGEEIDGLWVEEEIIRLRGTGEKVAHRVSAEALNFGGNR